MLFRQRPFKHFGFIHLANAVDGEKFVGHLNQIDFVLSTKPSVVLQVCGYLRRRTASTAPAVPVPRLLPTHGEDRNLVYVGFGSMESLGVLEAGPIVDRVVNAILDGLRRRGDAVLYQVRRVKRLVAVILQLQRLLVYKFPT